MRKIHKNEGALSKREKASLPFYLFGKMRTRKRGEREKKGG